jgi:hypothetical protein
MVVSRRIAVSPIIDPILATEGPHGLPSGHVDIVGAHSTSLRRWLFSNRNVFPKDEQSGLDPPPGSVPFSLDRADFLGSIAIPFSG